MMNIDCDNFKKEEDFHIFLLFSFIEWEIVNITTT